jgi:hypothetical protein
MTLFRRTIGSLAVTITGAGLIKLGARKVTLVL